MLVGLHLLDLFPRWLMVPVSLTPLLIAEGNFGVGIVALLHISRLLLDTWKGRTALIGSIRPGERLTGFG